MRAALAAILTLAVLTLAAPAQASILNGKMLTQCGPTRVGNIDTIVSPGTTSAHEHTGAGSDGWTTTSLFPELFAAPTECAIPANHSEYWAPTIINGSTHYGMFAFHVYYGAFGKDTRAILGGRIMPFPQGLVIVAGNRTGSSPPSSSVATWRCTNETHIGRTIPSTCGTSSVKLTFSYPSCWTGKSLDSANHESHMSYPVTMTLSDGSVVKGCPPTHPVAVPQLNAEFLYPPGAAGGRLSADEPGDLPGTKTHVDYISGWDVGVLSQIANCLSDPAHTKDGVAECGVVTTAGLATSVQRTGMDYRYVNSTGGVLP